MTTVTTSKPAPSSATTASASGATSASGTAASAATTTAAVFIGADGVVRRRRYRHQFVVMYSLRGYVCMLAR